MLVLFLKSYYLNKTMTVIRNSKAVIALLMSNKKCKSFKWLDSKSILKLIELLIVIGQILLFALKQRK
jgi:hypothetical protein